MLALARARRAQLLVVFGLLLASAVASQPASEQPEKAADSIPHISECDFCFKCIPDSTALPTPSTAAIRRRLLQRRQPLQDPLLFAPPHDPEEFFQRRGILSSSSSSADHGQQPSEAMWSKRGLLASKGIPPRPPPKPPKPPKPPNPPKPPKPPNSPNSLDDPNLPLAMRASAYRIGHHDKVPKSSLPNCTVCRGCNTQLSYMKAETAIFGRTFTNEKGATNGWLFQATTNHTQSGLAVVKVYCMPLQKRPGSKVPTCAPETILKNMRLLMAIEQISQECGFTDIVPSMWVDKIDAPVPDIGYHIRWHALWMDIADGVSMENLLNKGEPSRVPAASILDLFNNRLNKTQVIRGAIFDLLTSQCDRHAQNIFINEQGQLKLIDNEAALQSAWRNCAFNSILVPTTQKQEIVRLSNEFVLKLITPDQARKGFADPQVMLDYRCYLPDGKEEIGTDYGPQITKCLKDISAMTVAQVREHYGFLEDLPAYNLHARATAMITKGFEWATKYAEPRNQNPRRYRLQPKCCKLRQSTNRLYSTSFMCAHDWAPKFELPFGDPVTGREWTKDRPDTGSYEGGTFLDGLDSWGNPVGGTAEA